ncbi:MAG: hypothetical protein R3Y07_04635 [Eubacteriales bacterium]
MEENTLEQKWQTYFAVLRRLGDDLDKLATAQQEKHRAVSVGDVLTVDEIMKTEQALALSLRGLEVKRNAALKDLKVKGDKLSDLPNLVPDSLRDEAKKLAEDTLRKYSIYEAASKVAKNTLEINLRQIELAQGGQINYNSAGQNKSSDSKRRTDVTV